MTKKVEQGTPEPQKWMENMARELVEANADRGRSYDNSPDYLATYEIIAKHYAAAQSPPLQDWKLLKPFVETWVYDLKGAMNGDPRNYEINYDLAAEIIARRIAAAQAPVPSQPPMSESELEAIKEIAAKIPLIEHPRTYSGAAHELYDKLVNLKYNDHNRWRVQVELADGTKATIAVTNNSDGELARVQIRGMALQLLGHYLKSVPSPSTPGQAR
jgi:hypothetical protein